MPVVTRCHKLDTGRREKIKRKTTKDLAYDICRRSILGMRVTWGEQRGSPAIARDGGISSSDDPIETGGPKSK